MAFHHPHTRLSSTRIRKRTTLRRKPANADAIDDSYSETTTTTKGCNANDNGESKLSLLSQNTQYHASRSDHHQFPQTIMLSRKRRRRLRALAVFTTVTTTMLWWQTTLLLCHLSPHTMVEASTTMGGIVPPPPPPPPRPPNEGVSKTTQSSSVTAFSQKSTDNENTPSTKDSETTKEKAASSEEKTIPPPPPPRAIFKTTEKEIEEAKTKSSAHTKSEQADVAENRTTPPPPPPPSSRTSTETKKEEKDVSFPSNSNASQDTSGSSQSSFVATTKHERPPLQAHSYQRKEEQRHPQHAPYWQQSSPQNSYQHYNSLQQQQPNQYRPQQRQHLQQNVGYGRPPTNQNQRQIPHRASKPQPSKPSDLIGATLKGLWGRVEKGLDDLAGLEGTVAGQAQKLASKAISTASTASRLSPGTLRSLAQSAASSATSTASSLSPLGSSSRRRRPKARVPPPATEPLKPYGQKYQLAREAKEKAAQEEKQAFQPMQKRSISDLLNAELDKSMAAKGGATSTPYNENNNNSNNRPPEEPYSSSAVSTSSGSESDNTSGDPTSDGPTPDEKERSERNAYDRPPAYGMPSGDSRGPNSSNNNSYGSDPQRQSYPENSQGSNRETPASPNRDSWNRSNNGMDRGYNSDNQQQQQPSHQEYSQNGSRGDPRGNYPRGDPRGDPRRDPRSAHPRGDRRGDPRRDKSRDPHSRDNRIPWDTNAPNNRQGDPGSNKGQSPPRRRPDMRFDDYNDTPSWKRALQKISLPPLPNLKKLRLPRLRRSSNAYSYANLDAWDSTDKEERRGGIFGLFSKKSSSSSSTSNTFGPTTQPEKRDDDQPPLVTSMLSRCDNGKSVSLLRSKDARASKVIGRYKAVLDVGFLVSVLLGFKLLSGFEDLASFPVMASWPEMLDKALPMVGVAVNELAQGSWALFAFLYAALFRYIRERLLNVKIEKLSSSVASSVKEESEYAQLYLRLLAATPMDRNLPDRLAFIAKTQVKSLVSKTRLNSFVAIVLALLTVMTVSAVGPILMALGSALTKFALLEEWRKWPIPWEGLLGATSGVIQNLLQALESQGAGALRSFLDNPIQFSFHLSMFGSLLACALLPGLEERRAVAAKKSTNPADPDEDEVGVSNLQDSAEEWSRLGTSSASRLSMLSENGSVENALARWRASHIAPLDESPPLGYNLPTLLRLVSYGLAAAILVGAPIVVSHYLAGQTPSLPNALSIFRWDSLFDLSFLQVFLFGLVYQTFQKVIESSSDVSVVKKFQADLVSTKEEMDESNGSNSDFQVMGSVSPTAGMAVRDLWAAHATKRAWAVRGANLQCKNGEILAVLGEDGNGKTRLLTTIAEALTFPPKRAATTNKVRGLISIGGLDVSKWNRKMLKRRLGIFLSDVRMVADSASLFSGWTMEEILEPVDGQRSTNSDSLQRTYTKTERSAMLLALKITGLYKTLLARLPSKTSTIFTANEEDLRPTSLKPRSTVLSPGEWSKLMLARVLAQTIYDNDNSIASNDKIENSLVGSILLLDEPTTMHSEVDEGQLFRDLRLTGAATVISTNKWATGRFADQICVVKNGVIVEMGSHNELIARGPQQSLYAAKWHAMTLQ